MRRDAMFGHIALAALQPQYLMGVVVTDDVYKGGGHEPGPDTELCFRYARNKNLIETINQNTARTWTKVQLTKVNTKDNN